MNTREKEILNKVGWLEFDGNSTNDELISLATSIGQIQRHPNGAEIFTLTAKDGLYSTKGTFSNKFGFGDFPLHTDTAFYIKPIRYMILSMNKPSEASTTLLSIKRLFEKLSPNDEYLASRAIYKVKTNEGSFYSSLFIENERNKSFRYDSTCMFPVNNAAKEFEIKLHEIFSQVELENINWNKPKTIIIDNWKVLHGRSRVKMDEHRELKRIYIN